MKPNKQQQTGALVAVFLILAGVGAIAAGRQTQEPRRWDLSTVAACPVEDGPGPGVPAPCVWDALRDGDKTMGPYGRRWTLYPEDTCPGPETVLQSAAHWQCVSLWDWSGGTHGTRP